MPVKTAMVSQEQRGTQSQHASSEGERKTPSVQPATRLAGDAVSLAKYKKTLEGLSDEALQDLLTSELAMSVDSLIRLGAVVCEIERRGNKLNDRDCGILPFLRKIGTGRLLPEIVMKLSGKPEQLKRASNLPLDRQQRIVDDEDDEFEQPGPRTRNTSSMQVQRPTIATLVDSSAKDVADMAAEMVVQHKQPKLVFAHMVEILRKYGIGVPEERT